MYIVSNVQLHISKGLKTVVILKNLKSDFYTQKSQKW